MPRHWISLTLFLATAIAPMTANAQSASDLLEKAIYQEKTAGDLDAAIKIYQSIVEQEKASRPAIAQAHYRLGLCLAKKGDKAKAAEAFKAVVNHYSDQKTLAAEAQKELNKLSGNGTGTTTAPMVVQTSPAAFDDKVSASLTELTVTFDRKMMDKSWSWTGGGDTFPKTTGDIHYDASLTTCTMPVQLEPGKVYWVGINAPSFKNFQSADRVPAQRYVILFATADKDGNATPIPEDMLERAKAVNSARPQPATVRRGGTNPLAPVVVRSSPKAFDNAVSPTLGEMSVTFDRKMMDKSWSWTGGGDTFPKSAGDIHYDASLTTCTMPVQMEPGKVYWVGVNSPSHKNFQTSAHVPAAWYVMLFATADKDGKPTPIPEDMRERAKAINEAAAGAARSAKQVTSKVPLVLRTSPEALDGAVPTSLKEITVTFSRPMQDRSWSWTGGGDTYPKTTGTPAYDGARTTCKLPVDLEPGKVYWVGVNAASYHNFKSADGVPAPWYVILFATPGTDGKPTPIPEDMRERAKAINAEHQSAAGAAASAPAGQSSR